MVKNLSVFFPLFNEEGNVKATVQKATDVLEKLNLQYEIIVVNDGSTDKTQQVAESLAKKNSRVSVINHPQNSGYGEALKSGFYNAKYDTIVYTDGDGQFDFSQVAKFLEKIDDFDVLVGYRIKRQDPFFRILFKEGWRLSLFAFFRLTLKDIDCGFKMVKRKVLEKIPKLQSRRGAMINAELVIKAKKAGFKIGQIGVNHYARLSGRPTGAGLNVIIRSYLDLLNLWWELKKAKSAFIILVGILLLAAFFRFYRISEYMTFLGDEGRDALVIKNIYQNMHLPLIGPPTSVGNIYLGPLYYYMMAVVMGIFWMNPVAAAGMNAVIGVATIGFIYYLGKIWFSRNAGLVSAFLYAISPVTIVYSKTSWNPNPAPFFALLSIFGLYKANKTGNFLWLVLTGVSVAGAMQMHYLALILIPICLIIYARELFYNNDKKHLILGTVLAVVSFMFVMSPVVWFDLRHNFLNYKALTKLFIGGEALDSNIFTNFLKIPSLYFYNLVGRYITGENLILTAIVSPMVLLLFRRINWPIFALGTWLLVGLFGISFYQGSVYDHYLGFLNPVPFLLLGSFVVYFQKKWQVVGFVILIVIIAFVNLQKNPNLTPPNRQLQRTQQVAKFIINESAKKDFNFALLAKNNYDAAYQFYLEQFSHKPKIVPDNKTEQLFVVCEDEVCDPTHSPKYEIAAYGWSKIDWMKQYAGVKIYRLIPNPTGKP